MFAAACCLIAGGSLPAVTAHAAPVAAMEVTATPTRDGTQLEFEVKNLSPSAVEIDEALLPWGLTTSVWTRVQTFGAGCKPLVEYATLQEAPIIRHFVRIPPMAGTRGHVDLLDVWPGLKGRGADCDDVLFWSYGLVDRNQMSLGRFSGAIPLGHR